MVSALWRRIADVLQAHALAVGLAGLCGGAVAWVLTVLAHMPLWIAIIFALSIFLIAVAILQTVLPPILGWLAQFGRSVPPNQPTYHIGEFHLNVQITDSGNNTQIFSSEKVIVTSEGEGPLLPRGFILDRSWTEQVRMDDAWRAEVFGPMAIDPRPPPINPPTDQRSRRRSRRDPPPQPPSPGSGDTG